MSSAINVSAEPSIQDLKRMAHALRLEVVRLVAGTGQGYVQQGLGAADLFAVLYGRELRYDPAVPDWPERDRFILSTAHNSAIFGAALAQVGLLPKEILDTYCLDGSPYEINMSQRLGTVVEATCGSLGQGLSVGVGMALAGMRRARTFRCHVMLGDGELQEGQVWEAVMSAGHYELGNLCMVIDWNQMQVEGDTGKVMRMEPVADKLKAFNWQAIEIDGHDIGEIIDAFDQARLCRDKPTAIIAHTLVGKGVPSLEGIFGHNLKLPLDMAERARRELSELEPIIGER